MRGLRCSFFLVEASFPVQALFLSQKRGNFPGSLTAQLQQGSSPASESTKPSYTAIHMAVQAEFAAK